MFRVNKTAFVSFLCTFSFNLFLTCYTRKLISDVKMYLTTVYCTPGPRYSKLTSFFFSQLIVHVNTGMFSKEKKKNDCVSAKKRKQQQKKSISVSDVMHTIRCNESRLSL